ncbi:glycosyl transferase, family 2 [Richelia sinica FACHB-800]|uniref:Glycosyl transferase, family 2 n=2 Tax=Richelia TaxID=98443 RepID=A0A975Y2T3_9NOST|nr:glycosyl transferase, family 2 [Richelia sinica FACHB-800]
MPVFNCEKTISLAIRSILNQTYNNWELFIIDDGSTDKTLEIAQSFNDSRIYVIADGLHQNLPTRLNQVIAMSRGKYFARMDGDDISFPERIQTQVEYLENNPTIDLLGTQVIVFHQDGKARGSDTVKETHSQICSRPWSGFPMTHPTWIGRIEYFLKYQYRIDAIRMEDQDLLLRSYKTSKFACLPKILLAYRVESLSLKKILTGRYNFALALIHRGFADKDYFLFWGLLEQAAKSLVDIFAISTRLNFKLLKHRIGSPLSEKNLNKWNIVWSDCVQKN